MLHEDNPGQMAATSWQMQAENGDLGGEVSSRPLDFMARASRGHIGFGSQEFIPTHDDDKGPSKGQRSRANWPVSRRQVCWPPKPDYIEVPPSEDSSNQPSDSVDSSKVANGPTPPTVNTQFPAGFKMREQAPVQQTPPAMILSQPAFKISQPLKQKGESKWPPKDNVVTQEQVREFTKPKGGKRDYSEFFAQNALPQTFCSYRAPPGTQHHGEGETGVSEM